jgi:hypothetical protein
MKLFAWHPSPEALSRMLDGMLDSQAQSQTLKHLQGCTGCGRLFEGQAKVKAALKGLPVLEENPILQLQPPLFIPVIRPVFPVWGFAAGLASGFLVLAALVWVRPPHSPMRVISAPAHGSAELLPGEEMNSLPGDVDLEIPNQLLLRVRAGTTMTWQESGRPAFFGGRPQIVLNVMRGEVLARTKDKFWGSQLQIRTPSASALAKGTAFSVKVESEQDATVLKVLAGVVFFSPHLGRVGLNVQSGETSRIQGRSLPQPAQPLSVEERKGLLETYQIGQDPAVALVIGGGPERTGELLRPALLYLSMEMHWELHLFMRRQVAKINAAILQGNLEEQTKEISMLETFVQTMQDPTLAVPLRLFLGACDVRLGSVLRGRVHFRWVADRHPTHPLASVALAALGQTAERDLRNPELAQAAYQRLVSQYPASPEAELAREFLTRYSQR